MRRRSRGMAVLQKILNVLPLNEEQRRFQRVRVNLLGRYMLADRREFPCQVLDMSPGGMAIIGPVSGKRSEEHTSELQSHSDLVCRLLLEKKKINKQNMLDLSNNYSCIAIYIC